MLLATITDPRSGFALIPSFYRYTVEVDSPDSDNDIALMVDDKSGLPSVAYLSVHNAKAVRKALKAAIRLAEANPFPPE